MQSSSFLPLVTFPVRAFAPARYWLDVVGILGICASQLLGRLAILGVDIRSGLLRGLSSRGYIVGPVFVCHAPFLDILWGSRFSLERLHFFALFVVFCFSCLFYLLFRACRWASWTLH